MEREETVFFPAVHQLQYYMMDNRTDMIRKELNFRELGGLPVKDGRTVRRGILWRSGGLHLMTPQELGIVKQLGIRTVIDLRDRWSQKRKPDPDIGAVHVQYDGLPAKGGEKIDFSAAGFGQKGEDACRQIEKVRRYYLEMPYGYQAFHAMFGALLQGQAPFLFHCTKGKDRTGIASILILLALGAEKETALQDYLISNEYRRQEIEDRLAEGRAVAPLDEGYMTLMYLREGVKEDLACGVMDLLYQRYGSAEAYMMKEYGWSEAQLNAFRDLYLE